MTWDAEQREATAYHEAGHGVLHVLAGQRFRYITLRPRDRNLAGHVVSDQIGDSRKWRTEVAGMFAGLIAEDLWWWGLGPISAHHDVRRSDLVRYAASSDMEHARDELRYVLGVRRAEPDCLPMVDPTWTVQGMAVDAWRHAVLMVVANAEAVGWLADLLLASPRAVTWKQACAVVAGSTPTEVSESDPDIGHLMYPWFLDHCELDWSDEDPTHASAQPSTAAAKLTTGRES